MSILPGPDELPREIFENLGSALDGIELVLVQLKKQTFYKTDNIDEKVEFLFDNQLIAALKTFLGIQNIIL